MEQGCERVDGLEKIISCSTCRKHFPVLSSFTTYYRGL